MHDVVRHHVTQRAGGVIVAATSFNADGLSHRDLNVIDMIAIPDWLKETIAKAEYQNVLHSLFAEIVVDAVDLLFV